MDVMDIASMSLRMNQTNVMRDVNIAVLDNALEQQQADGAALTKMMEASVQPNLGQNFDVRV